VGAHSGGIVGAHGAVTEEEENRKGGKKEKGVMVF
jgi:hypothetical protein